MPWGKKNLRHLSIPGEKIPLGIVRGTKSHKRSKKMAKNAMGSMKIAHKCQKVPQGDDKYPKGRAFWTPQHPREKCPRKTARGTKT